MKYLLLLLVALIGISISSCDKDSCEEGEFSFYNRCIPDKGRVFYVGKPAFYCFDDSLAVGINVEDKTISNLRANALGQHGGGGGNIKYTEQNHFYLQCDTPEFGVTNTVVFFDDVSVLDDLPPSIKVNLYQSHIGPPFTRYDSTSLILYRR